MSVPPPGPAAPTNSTGLVGFHSWAERGAGLAPNAATAATITASLIVSSACSGYPDVVVQPSTYRQAFGMPCDARIGVGPGRQVPPEKESMRAVLLDRA